MPKLAYLLVLVTCCTIQALPACPIVDGSAPNSAACICEQGTEGECAAGDYCLKGGDQPCSYFPRCRARNVNWNTCLRCSPTNDFDCAVCKEGTFLYDGDCLDVNSDKIVSNGLAFAAILDDGSVQAWGDKEFGGEMIQGTGTWNLNEGNGGRWAVETSVSTQLTNVTKIVASSRAFLALKSDGSLISWGHVDYGGVVSQPVLNAVAQDPVRSIHSCDKGFLAVTEAGQMHTWGGTSSFRLNIPADYLPLAANVKSLHSTDSAWAVLTHNGTFLAWGDNTRGGLDLTPEENHKVQAIKVRSVAATSGAFAVLQEASGKVFAWGDKERGGCNPGGCRDKNGKKVMMYTIEQGARALFATDGHFAAILDSGEVRDWGGPPGWPNHNFSSVTPVRTLFAMQSQFFGLTLDGKLKSVIPLNLNPPSGYQWDTMCQSGSGSNDRVPRKQVVYCDLMVMVGSQEEFELDNHPPSLLSDIQDVYIGKNSIVVVNSDGHLVPWGLAINNGSETSSGWPYSSETSWHPQKIRIDISDLSRSVKSITFTTPTKKITDGKVTQTPEFVSASYVVVFDSGEVKSFGAPRFGGSIPDGTLDECNARRCGDETRPGYPQYTGKCIANGADNVKCKCGNQRGTFCNDLQNILPDIKSIVNNHISEAAPCPLGHFPDASSRICEECPSGWRTPDFTDRTKCVRCQAGGSTKYPAALSCFYCEIGEFLDQEGRCSVCPKGQYQDGSEILATSCTSCSVDTYIGFTNQAGQDKHDNQDDCVACPSGQFTNGKTGAAFCSPCSVGRYVRKDGNGCTDCPAGYKQEASGQEKCITCEEGTYMDKSGQPYCLPCVPGRFQDDVAKGSRACKSCSDLLVSTVAGATACSSCTDPNTVSNMASTACEPAPWKTIRDCKTFDEYLNNTNTNDKMSWTCLSCPPGGDCSYESTSNNLVPKDGWLNYSWASSEQPFAQCPFKSNACQNGTCTEGHTDTLCAVCEPGYTFSSSMQACTLCTTGQVLISVGIILVLGMMMLVFLWVKRKKLRKAQQKYSKGKGIAKFCS